jgi:hypothetical protein
MNFVDIKYINLCCSGFKNFHKKGEYLWNFSCPLCLDSRKNSRKARGYIFERNGTPEYYCHNCTKGLSLPFFLKIVNPELYRSFCLEKFEISNFNDKIYHASHEPKFINYNIFSDLKRISELSVSNPFKEFIIKRKIPDNYYSKLFACPNFMQWTNKIKPETFSLKSLKYDEPRIIIPFIDKQKNVIAFQGRSIKSSNNPKYLTISFDKNNHTIFGYDTVDVNNVIYVLEGAIDSFFIPNSLAISGSNLSSISKYLKKEQVVLIFDNEKRNEQIVSKMIHAIDEGYKIVIWPLSFEYKDINDGIINGISVENIMDVIKNNVFDKLNAKLQLSMWRK